MLSDDEERALRIAWLEKQMQKADFDMEAERRRFDQWQRNSDRTIRRQTVAIVTSGIGIVVAAFAAGAAWVHFFHS